MKYLIYILTIISFNSYAETQDEMINKACLQHAITLVNQLKSEVFTDMDETQSNKTLRMTTDSCKQRFNAQMNTQTVAATSKEQTEKSLSEENESNDWFTEQVLNGEMPDKAGNKRLKRLRHK